LSIPEFVATVLLFAAAGLPAIFLARFLRFLPLSAWLVGAGFLLGLGVEVSGFDTGIRAHNFQDLVFYVLLPILIFEAAYALPHKELRQSLAPILLMATLGLLISMVVTGIGVWYGINHPGFPFIAALLAGALLAATDPVAVVAQIKEMGAPRSLGVLVEGESLFNDATAIVAFSIILSLALAGSAELSAPAIFVDFLRSFFGGILAGVAVGIAAIFSDRLLGAQTPAAPPIFVTVIAAYGGFYLAEHFLHVSGVMAVLVAGLLVSREHQRRRSDSMREQLHAFWLALSYLFNVAVFVIMGLVITVGMFTERWLAMLIAIAAAFVGRIVAVYLSCWLAAAAFRSPVQRVYQPVLVWSGLRGVVTIALALSLPHDLPYWWTIQSIGFGVVLFTLLVQAPTNSLLMRRLKIS